NLISNQLGSTLKLNKTQEEVRCSYFVGEVFDIKKIKYETPSVD
ncbi:20889_t:CDS:1, partial [Dentiscutata erythropus]